MNAIPKPLDEDERLRVLADYAIMDTAPEASTDAIVRLAASIAEVPMALVSLVDEARQWFKARVGVDLCETPREDAFCTWAVYEKAPLIVGDATRDPRFENNPLVLGPPNIRAYWGFPLLADGKHCIGTLCVLDTAPRLPDARVFAELQALAEIALHQLEVRRTSAALADALERVEALGKLPPVCDYCDRLREDDAYRSSLLEGLERQTGTRVSHGICPDCLQQHFPEYADCAQKPDASR